MIRRMHVVALSVVALVAATGRADDAAWSPQRAAAYLDGRADWWLGWSSSARGQGTACISCHTALPFALARPALARRLGESAAGVTETRMLDGVVKRVESWDKIVGESDDKDSFRPFYGKERKPSALGTESVVNALVVVSIEASRGSDGVSESARKALGNMWRHQTDAGNWPWLEFGLRPWESDGQFYGAALAAAAVGTVGPSYRETPDVRPKVAALKTYMKAQFPLESLHNRTVALWASGRLPDILPADAGKQLTAELFAAQEADGGWCSARLGKAGAGTWKSFGVYPEATVSDGYATGLAVLALRRAGIARDDARLKRAVAWLAANERDGTWPINYLNKSRDPKDNVGKFMRDAATGFAVLALTEPEA